jgi:hypothetical protein
VSLLGALGAFARSGIDQSINRNRRPFVGLGHRRKLKGWQKPRARKNGFHKYVKH